MADWESTNYYVCSSQGSVFLQTLMISCVTHNARISVLNDQLIVRTLVEGVKNVERCDDAGNRMQTLDPTGEQVRFHTLSQRMTSQHEFVEMVKQHFPLNIDDDAFWKIQLPGIPWD